MNKLKKIFLVLIILLSNLGVFKISAKENLITPSPKTDEIQKRKKLIVGTSPDFPPYEFTSTINGKTEIAGFDIEIAREIAKELGVELELQSISFDGLLPALLAGNIDMILSGMSPTEERKQSVDFSDVYFKGEMTVITLDPNIKQLKDLDSKIIGAQKASIQEEAALKIPGVTVKSLPNILDLVMELKNKKIDGIVMAKAVGEQITKKDKEVLMSGITIEGEEGSAVALQKGDEIFVSNINKILEKLKNENKIDLFYSEAQLLADKEQQSSDSFFEKYGTMILSGTLWTLIVAFFGVIIGSVLGIFVGLGKLSKNKIISSLFSAYVELVRGTPLLVQIYIVYFGLPTLGVNNISPLVAGVFAISLNSAAYVAEIIRAGIASIDKGQLEASRSLGMTHSQAMKVIIIPQAIKNILPALGNEFVTIIKESSIISVIGVTDLMYVANTIRGNTYEPFKPLLIAAIIYFIITFTLSRGIKQIERKLNKDA